jgi:hypothetical protein
MTMPDAGDWIRRRKDALSAQNRGSRPMLGTIASDPGVGNATSKRRDVRFPTLS